MLRRASDPLIVDLGYGATGITTLELAARLSPVRPDIDVLGLEIDPERVERAREQLRAVRAGLTTGRVLAPAPTPAPNTASPRLVEGAAASEESDEEANCLLS